MQRGCSGATLIDDPTRRGQDVDWGLFVNQTQSYRRPICSVLQTGSRGFQVDRVVAVKRIT